ncbi:hypothetical protein [Streptomyces sp. NPDC127098]|uniref:hypothetical protein n=1 Tax=Streptomyces sp. NPDC127098 TaxID=3347137 RepID=UPI0036527476
MTRGLRRLVTAARERWARVPRERRVPVGLVVVAGALVVPLLPYGAWLAGGGLLAAVVVLGVRDGGRAEAERAAAGARLTLIYEALVPYFGTAPDPSGPGLYAPGGSWRGCFLASGFGADGRLEMLRLAYPAFFPDGDHAARERVEGVLVGKAGRDREYHFRWDEERNELEVVALPPLPAGIGAQRFVVGAGETVLGFTDEAVVDRRVPVRGGAEYAELVAAPPVVWRTGPRAGEPHLLVAGAPGSGVTSLLRSVVLQALERDEVLLVDGGGEAQFGCFAGRVGVAGVESGPGGGGDALRWVARETERRLSAAGRGRSAAVGGALWVVVDRPALLGHLARLAGGPDPSALLEVPLRYGRAVGVTVVLGEQLEGLGALGGAVFACTRARVVLGAVAAVQAAAVLGAPPCGSPVGWVPPGRGFARLGAGPVVRLQVPVTPDPYDLAADEPWRRAVSALLPPMRVGGGGGREVGAGREA